MQSQCIPFKGQALPWWQSCENNLLTWPNTPPIARQVKHYPCRTVFDVVSPPLLSEKKMAYRSPKTDLTRRASQKKKKLASEAYGAIGGVARNSIANRACYSGTLKNSSKIVLQRMGGDYSKEIILF